MSTLKYINLCTPEESNGDPQDEPHRHSLGYFDGGDRLITFGVIPHGSQWVPATHVDRNRLVQWLKRLDYSAGGPLVGHLGGKHGNTT